MKGDIALVGFVLTADEWDALDAAGRAQLLTAAFEREVTDTRSGSATPSDRAEPDRVAPPLHA
jgi:hypothetical protein